MQQRFPSSWKLSKVLPSDKKEDPLERKSDRPVVFLSPLSKAIDKIEDENMGTASTGPPRQPGWDIPWI